ATPWVGAPPKPAQAPKGRHRMPRTKTLWRWRNSPVRAKPLECASLLALWIGKGRGAWGKLRIANRKLQIVTRRRSAGFQLADSPPAGRQIQSGDTSTQMPNFER
ncbi:MAG: hypothetical protein RMK20_07950, partial [Verrucomicrobiales bacterium]|nr:hypothetical protein [Verrucomicrobiales bacterium]